MLLSIMPKKSKTKPITVNPMESRYETAWLARYNAAPKWLQQKIDAAKFVSDDTLDIEPPLTDRHVKEFIKRVIEDAETEIKTTKVA